MMIRPSSFIGAALLVLVASCVEGNFLEGVRCSDDRDCGRNLACSAGFCGGCPENARLDDGTCGCAGDRILECGGLDPAGPCVSICESERDVCQVVIVLADQRQELPACIDAEDGQRCFSVELDAATCNAGQERIVLEPAEPVPSAMVVNCPPPASEDSPFECGDG